MNTKMLPRRMVSQQAQQIIVPGIVMIAWCLFALGVVIGVIMLATNHTSASQGRVISAKQAAFAEGDAFSVKIVTSPSKTQEPIFVDINQDLRTAPEELVGYFPVYDGNNTIDFTWNPYPFAAGVNGSYRIALWQDIYPLASTPTFVEHKVAHHWAQNPNGTFFVMGSFGYGEDICTYCPSYIVILSETFTVNYTPSTNFTEYIYTFIDPEALTDPAQQGTVIQISQPFVISIIR